MSFGIKKPVENLIMHTGTYFVKNLSIHRICIDSMNKARVVPKRNILLACSVTKNFTNYQNGIGQYY